MNRQTKSSALPNFIEQKVIPINIYMIFYSLLFLPGVINSAIIIILGINWLYLTLNYNNYSFKRFSPLPLLPVLYYFMILIGLSYTSNLNEGLHKVEVNLSLIVFPLIFFYGHDILYKVKLNKVLNHIVFAVLIACLYSHIFVIYNLASGNHSFFYYTYLNLSQYLSIHPGYFSMYISFAILVILINLNYYKERIGFSIYLIIIYLIGFIFLLLSRTSIISFLLVLSIFIVFNKKITNQYKIAMVIISFVLFMSFMFSSDGKERVIAPIEKILRGELETITSEGTLKYRSRIYTCAFNIITKENLILGYGTGDVNSKLFECYINKKYDWIYSQKYNTHSEYLSSLLSGGLIKLFVFLSLLILPLFICNFRFKIFTYFILLFALVSLTENTLNVQKGSVYFGFFYTLFSYFCANSLKSFKVQNLIPPKTK